MLYELLKKKFDIDKRVFDFFDECEGELLPQFKEIDNNALYNQAKVLSAMQKHNLSEAHLGISTGYGYNDLGRDTLEEIYADLFNAEDALVRPQIISGTHALTVALFGNLRYGDELLSPAGPPYDTLQSVIGANREVKGSLTEHGVIYKQVDLLEDEGFDYEAIKNAITDKTKLVTIQRSKGYSFRHSFSVQEIGELISFVKSIKPDVICMVDNCYGEFVDTIEPIDVGADLIVGSLIKNIGGGLAPVGGYIAGKKEYVENASYHLSVPGMGKEVGPSLGITSSMLQGLFYAPNVVAGALKGSLLLCRAVEKLGFEVSPKSSDKRSDIVQAINLNSPENVIAFCRGVQAAAPVDSFVVPEPWAMPGYDCEVIMAAGAFIQGSSIELSADAPMKEPYTVYFQGGITPQHARLGVLLAINQLYKNSLISL